MRSTNTKSYANLASPETTQAERGQTSNLNTKGKLTIPKRNAQECSLRPGPTASELFSAGHFTELIQVHKSFHHRTIYEWRSKIRRVFPHLCCIENIATLGLLWVGMRASFN